MFDFKKEVDHIGGWLTEDEGLFLHETAKRVNQENAIVEIGSWKGRSTVCLGRGSQDGSHASVYAIDHHRGSSKHQKMFRSIDTFDEFKSNIRNAMIDDYIVAVRETSEHAARTFDKPVQFLFVDGEHEFKSVNADITSWLSKVIAGGVIAFHDSWHFVGPNIATALLLLTSRNIRNPRLIDTTTIVGKVEHNTIADRLKNACFLVARMFSGSKGFRKLKAQGINR